MNSYPARRYYERVAEASGYPLAALERVFRLSALLADIAAHAGDELLFCGGTALNLLHLDAPRLSVDLDLDYVGSADAGEAQARRKGLIAELGRLADSSGYRVDLARQSYALAHLTLRYENTVGRSDALKIDLNFLDRVPVLGPVRMALRHPFGDDLSAAPVLTFALAELAASKIVALARRGLARDLFDVAELAQIPDLDRDVVRTVLAVRGAGYAPPSPEHYSPTAGDRVRTADWRAQVVALARRDQPVDLTSAKQQTRQLLRDVLHLQPNQVRFLRNLEAGNLDATGLGDAELVARAHANPSLLWRIQRGIEGLEER